MDTNKSNFYNKLLLLSKNELEVLLEEIMNEVGKNLTHLKSSNKNVGKMLENNEYCNTNFEHVELIEYKLDEFFEKYKFIKQKIAKARLINYKLNEHVCIQDIPEELAKLGCKRVINNQ